MTKTLRRSNRLRRLNVVICCKRDNKRKECQAVYCWNSLMEVFRLKV
jgi:hypothetical protein